jgi:hypothetical protein
MRFETPEADSTAIMCNELRKSFDRPYYRRFFTGHSGCGKSTEFTRLSRELADQFEFIRLSVQNELSPFSAQPFDVLEIMALLLVERAEKLGLELDLNLLEKVRDWFATVTITSLTESEKGAAAEVEAGAGVPGLFKSILSLRAKVQGQARYSGSRKEETVRNRLERISDLTRLSNDLYRECNKQLRHLHRKEWVFLIEDFDKESVAEQVVDQLFVRYAKLWSDLETHLVCTIPLWLGFGEKGAALPLHRRALVDIPVFGKDHQSHIKGRAILRGIIEGRVDPELFGLGVEEYLIQAAGGNLRDTFWLITEAANFAEVIGTPRIEKLQADRAVNALRNEYLKRLGETSQRDISYEDKAAVLVRVYTGSKPMVQDPVLYRLLRARVVHEYNDSYWYGLPPMIVDILIQQGRLPAGSRGGLESSP